MQVSGKCKICEIKSSAVEELSPNEIEDLENNCVSVNFKKGDSIFKQGIFSSNIIYLTKGIVKIHIDNDEIEHIVKFVKAPSFIGVPTTIQEKINCYSATSVSEVSVCIINKETFKSFIHSNGRFAYEVITDLCCDELKFFEKTVNKSQKQIQGRLADTLLFFSEEIYNSKTFLLPVSRADLGNYIYAARESVSRILTEFSGDNIIDLSGKKITILNKEMLQEISQTL